MGEGAGEKVGVDGGLEVGGVSDGGAIVRLCSLPLDHRGKRCSIATNSLDHDARMGDCNSAGTCRYG